MRFINLLTPIKIQLKKDIEYLKTLNKTNEIKK